MNLLFAPRVDFFLKFEEKSHNSYLVTQRLRHTVNNQVDVANEANRMLIFVYRTQR